jgi:hypothetical protein
MWPGGVQMGRSPPPRKTGDAIAGFVNTAIDPQKAGDGIA